MTVPAISVVIPAYNARSTIVETVQSAIRQTHPPVEVIVVDDGSTDGTAELLELTFGDEVRVVSQENRGVAEARNRGIAETRGEYIQFLDSDDLLAPEKLARSIETCELNRRDVSYSQAQFVSSDGISPTGLRFPTLPSGDVLLEWLTGTMANGSFGVASSMFVHRRALISVGGFEKSCTPCEDWDMWIRLACHGQFAALNEPLVTYRVMPGGLSRHALRMARGRLTVIQRARQWPEVQARLSKAQLDSLEAGRWHVYALRLWEHGERREARAAFEFAQHLAPSRVRRLYSLMSYALPAQSTTTMNRVLQLMRRISINED